VRSGVSRRCCVGTGEPLLWVDWRSNLGVQCESWRIVLDLARVPGKGWTTEVCGAIVCGLGVNTGIGDRLFPVEVSITGICHRNVLRVDVVYRLPVIFSNKTCKKRSGYGGIVCRLGNRKSSRSCRKFGRAS
jgi:hypothetical protein